MDHLVDVIKQVEMDFAEEETLPRGLAGILTEAVRITKSGAGAIFITDPVTNTLRLTSIKNLADDKVLDMFGHHEQEILKVFSVSKKESFTFRDRVHGLKWLVRALRVKRKVMGLMFVVIADNASELDAHQENALTVLLSICSGLLDNAHQREKAKWALIGMAKAFSASLDAKDKYTHGHAERVTLYALAIAAMAEKHVPKYYIPHSEVRLAGLLHDIGKIGIPDSILCKPSKLSKDEYEVIKSHAAIGRSMLSSIPELKIALDGMLHHERYDGHGYPLGLSGDAIPLIARILSVADAYDAMTSDRPYREGLSPATALTEIREMSGTQFDPMVCELFEHAYNEGLIHSILEVHEDPGLKVHKTGVDVTASANQPRGDAEICSRIFARLSEIRFGTPSGPSLIAKLEDSEVSINDIAKYIEKDTTLATRILQLSNSSFYCFPRRIRTIEQGIIILGLRETRRIVHVANMMTLFQGPRPSNFDVTLFWKHSLDVGLIAKFLAERFNNQRLVEDSFLVGVMHDIGKLAMMNLHLSQYENVINHVTKDRMTFSEAEVKEFGISHDRASVYLFEKWNMPSFLGEILRCHHAETDRSDNRLLSRIVKAADDLSYRSSMPLVPGYPVLPLTDEACQMLGLKDDKELQELVSQVNALLAENSQLFEISVNDSQAGKKLRSTNEDRELASVS